jgi:hypothetical protein
MERAGLRCGIREKKAEEQRRQVGEAKAEQGREGWAHGTIRSPVDASDDNSTLIGDLCHYKF